ncbi:EAL domain-containing protein [Cohaesibacter sp. CAU 1516]|nr:EAL domain-containing protein [Cohaesibacter sp. CAU 1516]
MLTVLSCIYFDHNLVLVLVAALICPVGATVTVQLLHRSVVSSDPQRLGWQFLASVAGAGGVWATHFVAMLAYEPEAPVSFDPTLTILSLLVAMLGLFISFGACSLVASPVSRWIGGALAGLSFAAMHYVGMFAYRIVGLVEWNLDFVYVSIAIPVVCSSAATALIWQEKFDRRRFSAAVGLFVFGIVSLHFSGMTALSVTPMSQSFSDIDSQAVSALALAITIAALIIIGAGLTSYLIDSNMRTTSNRQLHHLAVHDALTGLPNRTGFQHELIEMLDWHETSNNKLAVVCIDLNRFKEVNDMLGHVHGDEVLRVVARRLQALLTNGEFVARMGGDEFAVLKPFSDKQEVLALARRLGEAVRQPIPVGDSETAIGASLGAAIWPDDAQDLDQLAKNADIAMYYAKDNMIEDLCFYDAEIGADLRRRRQMADALRQAMERDELTLHYQVQTSLGPELAIRGFEALLRWTHPEEGPISPAIFIPIAEESGLVGALGKWVLRKACMDAVSWDNSYRIAVNVSAVQFVDSDLPRQVHEILLETGLSPSRLELELTETALVKDKLRSLHIMRQIKQLGVGIALDDFGTGYSSLEILRTYPFDKIKLDKSFVDEIETDIQSKAIVRAVLALGKSLEIPVLAEGIETSSQMEILRIEGCNEGQGYLLGHPRPLTELLAEGKLAFKTEQSTEASIEKHGGYNGYGARNAPYRTTDLKRLVMNGIK